MHVVVIGAGAFGGWTALFLKRSGLRVTLVDAWGPGNSRSSSGGETRILRSIYGDDRSSTRMAARSLALWKEHEQRWRTQLYIRTGVVFFGLKGDSFLAASKDVLAAENIAFEELSAVDAARRFPQISFHDIDTVLLEPDAGALLARENCRTVVQHLVAEGGEFTLAAVRPVWTDKQHLAIELTPGGMVYADAYVFACGPWLGELFPDIAGTLIHPTRQEVLFVGTPSGSAEFLAGVMPCWADRTSEGKFYGIPDIQNRGFKLASDVRGPAFDPNQEDRCIHSSAWANARAYISHRFPKLSPATLLEARVCQYENSPDFGFLIDRHPKDPNVWLVGGGSGHGYKHGPAVGEYVAGLVTSSKPLSPEFCVARFAKKIESSRKSSTI